MTEPRCKCGHYKENHRGECQIATCECVVYEPLVEATPVAPDPRRDLAQAKEDAIRQIDRIYTGSDRDVCLTFGAGTDAYYCRHCGFAEPCHVEKHQIIVVIEKLIEALSMDRRAPQAKEEITGDDLAVVMRAIRPLDRGALHCRYCRAGSNNQWQHDEHCIYDQSVKEAEQARAIIASLRVHISVDRRERPESGNSEFPIQDRRERVIAPQLDTEDSCAGLIGQVASPLAETEPRPNGDERKRWAEKFGRLSDRLLAILKAVEDLDPIREEVHLLYADVAHELIDGDAPAPECMNCGHSEPHDGYTGGGDGEDATRDGCTRPGCNCGWYSPPVARVIAPGEQEQEEEDHARHDQPRVNSTADPRGEVSGGSMDLIGRTPDWRENAFAGRQEHHQTAGAPADDNALDSVCRFYPQRWFGDSQSITWRQVIEAFDGLHAELEANRQGNANGERMCRELKGTLQQAHAYLSRLLKHYAPQCEPLPSLMGVVTQIDNLLVGSHGNQVLSEASPSTQSEALDKNSQIDPPDAQET